MSWRYQVVRHKEGRKITFAIHEAYLNEDGTIWAITEDPIPADSDSLAGVKNQLKQMLQDAEDFGVFDAKGPFAKRSGDSIRSKKFSELAKAWPIDRKERVAKKVKKMMTSLAEVRRKGAAKKSGRLRPAKPRRS